MGDVEDNLLGSPGKENKRGVDLGAVFDSEMERIIEVGWVKKEGS